MREAVQTRRLGPLPAAAGLLAVAALVAPSWAPAAHSEGAEAAAAPVSIELLSPSREAILSGGRVRARVRGGIPGLVIVKPKVILAGSGGKATRIGKPRRIRFAKSGSRKVKLRLKSGGRALLASCEAEQLVLRAKLRAAGAGAAAKRTGRARTALPLSADGFACRPGQAPPGGVPGGGGPGGGDPGGENGNVIPPPQDYSGNPINTTNFHRCDFLDGAVCLQPWPNDYFTAADAGTDTGRRINLNADSMPKNSPLGLGLPVKGIAPTDHNRGDGFSPGNLIVARVPGLDNPEAFENTGAVSIDDPEAYDDPGQPIVVINADTGERHPVWSEIDFNPIDPSQGKADSAANRAKVNLIIRPLANFEEGARYVVALRNLRDESGEPIEPADAFRAYRDNLTTTDPAFEGRRAHMEELFEILGQSQIQRSGLYLAWDFTVASERSLSERMLRMRDAAFSQLGDDDLADGAVAGDAPTFGIHPGNVQNFDPCGDDGCQAGEDPRIARSVAGTVYVPCFMKPDCGPTGTTFNLGADGLPVQNGTATVNFYCNIPRAALDDPDAAPARPSLYGHGLLGSATEVNGGNVDAMAAEHNFVFCATDWYGFSSQNLINILLILQDLSNFPSLVDPSQQGFLNFLFLGRLMVHPDGLVDDPAFQAPDGDPLIDTDQLFYDGNSQGGILGGGLTAVAPDFERAVLGVPGMNYSTLLRRSVDFEPYAEGVFGPIIEGLLCDQLGSVPVPEVAAVLVALCAGLIPDDTPLGLYDNYPNELERPLILSLMQMLWDRGEANGYAQHMTDDPLPNTPPHEVLLHAAYGDHQVANVTAEVEARTIGASVYQPALDPGRHWEADGSDQIFGIPAVPSFPFGGSALVYWDGGPLGFAGGTEVPPNENIPPRPPEYGADPHSYPRNDVKGRAQKAAFLSVGGALRNPCTTTNNVASPPLPIALDTGTPIPCYANGWLGP